MTPGDRWSEKSAEAVVVTREGDEGLNGEEGGSPVFLEAAMRQCDEATTAGHGDQRSGARVRTESFRMDTSPQLSELPDADPHVRWCGRGPIPYADVRPAWALTWRWKSSGDLVAGIQAKRKVLAARGGLKEAWSESAG